MITLSKTNLAVTCKCDPTIKAVIRIRNKDIGAIDPATFKRLNSLRVLDLKKNKLTKIDPSTFNGLTSLKELHLSENNLTAIESATFNGLTSLQEYFWIIMRWQTLNRILLTALFHLESYICQKTI